MNQAMKQRLVGAIVLGCLAIIFLPILLDGEGVSTPEMNIVIPAAPAFPEPLEVEPQRPVVLSDTPDILIETEEPVEVVDAIPVNDTEAGNQQELPGLDAEGLPEAWSIRLGLFGETANADTLVNELLRQGLHQSHVHFAGKSHSSAGWSGYDLYGCRIPANRTFQ